MKKTTYVYGKNVSGSANVLKKTYEGFPFGVPKFGEVVNIPGFGKAHCILGRSSAFINDDSVVSVTFVVDENVLSYVE